MLKKPKILSTILFSSTIVVIGVLSLGLISSHIRMKELKEIHIPMTQLNGILRLSEGRLEGLIERSIVEKKDEYAEDLLVTLGTIKESISEVNKIIERFDRNFVLQRDLLSYLQKEIILLLKERKFKAAGKKLESVEYQVERRLYDDKLVGMIEVSSERRDMFIDLVLERNKVVLVIVSLLIILWAFSVIRIVRMLTSAIVERRDAYHLLLESKEQFRNIIRIVSHDLSTPLSLVLSYAANAKADPDISPELNQDYWNNVYASTKNMVEIVDSARELEAIESGKRQMELKATTLSTIIEDLQRGYKLKLEEKSVALNIHQDNPELKVLADSISLQTQVLSNILSNAIKFSEEGAKIDFIVKELDKEVQIDIKDRGIGIPKDLMQKIFSPTESTTRPGTANEQGTGFGMPIMKSYVERNKGRVEVISSTLDEDPLNHGTTFRIFLKKAA